MVSRFLLALVVVLGPGPGHASSGSGASAEGWIPEAARERAPKLALRDLNGKKRRLEQLEGKLVVVNFWATWCGPCQGEMPAFSEVHSEYRDRGVEVIGAANEAMSARDSVADFVRRLEIGFPIWMEASADHMEAFGVGIALPATVIVDRQGRVAARIVGATDAAHLRSILDRLLSETSRGRRTT